MVNKSSIKTAWCLIAVAVLCAVPSGFGAVNMTLTGVGNNGVLGGVYVGPYVATIEGVGSNVQVICDDFVHDTYLNQNWTANVYNLADVIKNSNNNNILEPLVYRSQGIAAYEKAAWLTFQLLDPLKQCTDPHGNCAADIQFAIWENFSSPTAFGALIPNGADYSNANEWLAKASAVDYTHVDFSNVYIYTPTTASAAAPQEFMRVRTPEPSELAVLGLDLSFLGFLAFRFRRRIIG